MLCIQWGLPNGVLMATSTRGPSEPRTNRANHQGHGKKHVLAAEACAAAP